MIEYGKITKKKSLKKSSKTVVLSTRITELQMAAFEMIARKNRNITPSQLLKVIIEEFLASAMESMESIHIEDAMEILSKYGEEPNLNRYDDYVGTPAGLESKLNGLYRSNKFDECTEIEMAYIFKDTLRFEKNTEMLSIIEKYDEMTRLPQDLIDGFSLKSKEAGA